MFAVPYDGRPHGLFRLERYGISPGMLKPGEDVLGTSGASVALFQDGYRQRWESELHAVFLFGDSRGLLISRGAMMQGLMRVDGGSEAVPFVRMFYGSTSEYLWEDSHGVVHTIPHAREANRETH